MYAIAEDYKYYYFKCKKCGSEKLIEKVEIVPFTTA